MPRPGRCRLNKNIALLGPIRVGSSLEAVARQGTPLEKDVDFCGKPFEIAPANAQVCRISLTFRRLERNPYKIDFEIVVSVPQWVFQGRSVKKQKPGRLTLALFITSSFLLPTASFGP